MTLPKPLFFATDADIFDQLEPAVKRFSKKHLLELALRRGIILSPSDERSDIIQFISMLPFSHAQLEEICQQTETAGRSQRTTSIRVTKDIDKEKVQDAISLLKQARSSKDEQLSVARKDDHFEITVEYAEFDHRKSALRQRSVNQISIQVESSDEGELTVRHTANKKAQEIAQVLLSKLGDDANAPVPTAPISLAGIVDRSLRTLFWVKLIRETDGLSPVSVTKAGVSREMTSSLFDHAADEDEDEEELNENDDNLKIQEVTGLINRAVFEGEEVLESTEFKRTEASFFVYKASWLAQGASGDKYEIEAEFKNPASASQFEYIFRGVYRKKASGGYYKSAERLLPAEQRQFSQTLENSAHAIVAEIAESVFIPIPSFTEEDSLEA
jgi:hypothetical protein